MYEAEWGVDTVTIVIVDFQMPMLTGLDVVREVRATYQSVNNKLNGVSFESQSEKSDQGQMRMPTFCLFSVHNHKAFVDYARDKGVNYFLEKPPNPSQLNKVIQDILNDAEEDYAPA